LNPKAGKTLGDDRLPSASRQRHAPRHRQCRGCA
jgi:hypothetical protein